MHQPSSIWRHLFKTPHRLGYVEVAGVQTRYLEAGPSDAPALLLLHGTAGSLENFCANYADYAQHFRVIGIDMLGCGWTDKPDFDYLIKARISEMASYRKLLGSTLLTMPNVRESKSYIVMEEVKETLSLPIPD